MINIRDFTEDDMATMFPELQPEDRAEAATNFTQYLRLVARIYNRLEAEGKVPKSIIRAAEKRRKRMEKRKRRGPI